MARGIPAEVIRQFRSIPLFASLSRRELRVVVQAAAEIDEPAGTTLVREGDEGREMYVLVSGTARVTRGGRKIRDLGPGEFFGELAFVSRAPRTATVTTTSNARLFVLGPREFSVAVRQDPKIAVGMLTVVAERLRETERSSLG